MSDLPEQKCPDGWTGDGTSSAPCTKSGATGSPAIFYPSYTRDQLIEWAVQNNVSAWKGLIDSSCDLSSVGPDPNNNAICIKPNINLRNEVIQGSGDSFDSCKRAALSIEKGNQDNNCLVAKWYKWRACQDKADREEYTRKVNEYNTKNVETEQAYTGGNYRYCGCGPGKACIDGDLTELCKKYIGNKRGMQSINESTINCGHQLNCRWNKYEESQLAPIKTAYETLNKKITDNTNDNTVNEALRNKATIPNFNCSVCQNTANCQNGSICANLVQKCEQENKGKPPGSTSSSGGSATGGTITYSFTETDNFSYTFNLLTNGPEKDANSNILYVGKATSIEEVKQKLTAYMNSKPNETFTAYSWFKPQRTDTFKHSLFIIKDLNAVSASGKRASEPINHELAGEIKKIITTSAPTKAPTTQAPTTQSPTTQSPSSREQQPPIAKQLATTQPPKNNTPLIIGGVVIASSSILIVIVIIFFMMKSKK